MKFATNTENTVGRNVATVLDFILEPKKGKLRITTSVR